MIFGYAGVPIDFELAYVEGTPQQCPYLVNKPLILMKNVLTYVSQHNGDGLLEFVESGNPASSRRRSLRFEVCAFE